MNVLIDDDRCVLVHGDASCIADCLDENSVDAIVTDPPAGIAFMNKSWDRDKGGRDAWIAWLAELLKPAFRALKPGGHALVWAIPRTSHWTAMAVELAGFEIRDVHHHIFGTGFPKSANLPWLLDKALGHNRKSTAEPITDQAKACEMTGTAFKPAVEHWILARKPMTGQYAENYLEHGTGGLNIDGCRIEYGASGPPPAVHSGIKGGDSGQLYGASGRYTSNVSDIGRWPAHLSLEHAPGCNDGEITCVLGCPVRTLDEQSGASRFFYVAKGSRAEKDAGLAHLQPKTGGEATGREDDSDGTKNPRAGAGRGGGVRNSHPTVKSVSLMRWLVRLVTPPGGIVLDMFAGSGTTGVAALAEGCRFIGVEQGGDDGEYLPIIEGRLKYALTGV